MNCAIYSAAILLLAAGTNAAAEWVNCAREDGFCKFDGRREVTFGAGNKWVTKWFTDGVKCSTNKFGDPAPQVPKTCSVRVKAGEEPAAHVTPAWVRCANEGGVCKFNGERKVGYGAGARFKYRVFRNGARCTNETFGDPAPGIAKACFYDPR